jgi:hypothetical protein
MPPVPVRRLVIRVDSRSLHALQGPIERFRVLRSQSRHLQASRNLLFDRASLSRRRRSSRGLAARSQLSSGVPDDPRSSDNPVSRAGSRPSAYPSTRLASSSSGLLRRPFRHRVGLSGGGHFAWAMGARRMRPTSSTRLHISSGRLPYGCPPARSLSSTSRTFLPRPEFRRPGLAASRVRAGLRDRLVAR